MRFHLRTVPLVRPLLLVFGAVRGNSFVELEERTLRVRFGPPFDERLELEALLDAQPTRWPLIGGIGWRTSFTGAIALVGSTKGVVRIRLKQPARVRFFFVPLKCRDLYVSLERPEEFVAALSTRLTH